MYEFLPEHYLNLTNIQCYPRFDFTNSLVFLVILVIALRLTLPELRLQEYHTDQTHMIMHIAIISYALCSTIFFA